MSVNYGGPPFGSYNNAPSGRVDFGWIGQAFQLVIANWVVWVVSTLMSFIPSVIAGIIGGIVGATGAIPDIGHPQPTYGAYPRSTSFPGINPSMITGNLPPGIYFAIQVFTILYLSWLYGGIFRTAVKQARGEAISINDIFSGGPLIWKMLGFRIISSLAISIAFVFCILPGFLVAGLLLPAHALIADGETVGNAISRSVDAMKQDMWNAAAFVFVTFLVVFAGALACGVGLFVTIPIYYLVSALAYRDMVGMPGGTSGPAYGTYSGYTPPQGSVWPPPPEARPPAFGQPIDPEPPTTLPPTE